MTNRPKCWPMPDTIRANAVAAEALMPSFAEQFSTLDAGIQSRAFALLNLVAGQSHGEKQRTRLELFAVRDSVDLSPETADLLAALDLLTFYVDRLATPVVDGQPTGLMAEKVLAWFDAGGPEAATKGGAA